MKITNLYNMTEQNINLLPLIRHWLILKSSVDLKSTLEEINRSEKRGMYQDNGILFKCSQRHPTFDFLSLRFDNALMVTDAVFYNMTLSKNHTLNINAHFISYVSLLLDINKNVRLELCYVTSEKNYFEFDYKNYPQNQKELDKKLQNLEKSKKPEIELEKNSFEKWNKEYESKFKFTNLLVTNDIIKANVLI